MIFAQRVKTQNECLNVFTSPQEISTLVFLCTVWLYPSKSFDMHEGLLCSPLRDSSNESGPTDAVALSMSIGEIEDPEVKGKKKRGRPGKQTPV